MKRTGRLSAVAKKWNAKAAERRLDKLWAEAIKLRDGKCQRTGRTENLQAAHIFSRSQKSTRHDLLNGVCLSAGVHLFWAHKNPVEFTLWCQQRLGERLFTLLTVRASKPASPLDPFTAELKEQELRTAIAGYRAAISTVSKRSETRSDSFPQKRGS
jgi:hypothetical protein